MIDRTRIFGGTLLALILIALAAAPVLSPNPPDVLFQDLAFAPPMRPRLIDGGGIRRPFVYPWRLADDRRTLQFQPDTSRPREITFFHDGRVASTSPEPWLLLGGDPLGRDVFSRLLAGGRLSFGVAFFAALLALALGSTLGAAAGFAGGRTDRTITAVADLVIVLPLLYVVVTLRASLPLVLETTSIFWTMVAVMGLATWPVPARGVRAIVAAERQKPYAESAYAVGAGPLRILRRHLLPAAAGHIAIQGLLLFPAFIFAEATLSFVGLGFADPTPSWGIMLHDAAGIAAMTRAPWLMAPAAVIVLTVVAIQLVIRGSETRARPRQGLSARAAV
ncbi:MAG: ABC transporter permease [Acidobacteriota bacterium]|nr:ABC transporter permease [Acidobacteriota bacterium]